MTTTDNQGASAEPNEAQIVAAARKMSDLAAQSCGIHPEDNWNIYGDEYRCDARAVLEAVFAAQPVAAKVEAAPQGEQVANYKPGRWFDARTLDEMQAFYLSRLPAIREAAKEHGYAIGLHGSERRDFDLMAMQWREGASDKDTLARAIADAACGIRREGAYEWERKPLGRVATSIPVCWTAHDNPDFDKPSVGHIDLSIIEGGATQPGRNESTERAAGPAEHKHSFAADGYCLDCDAKEPQPEKKGSK